MNEPKSIDPMIAALLRERDGYLRLGKTGRAAVVDEQLALRGHVEAENEPPRGRSIPPKQAADQQPGQARPARKATQKAD